MTTAPTHLDLFSGIGGFALAAGWAGYRTVAFSEIDDYASQVLRKHWPDIPNLGDIRHYAGWPNFGNVSLITGGFPCQPYSLAGKRCGKKDDRYIWPTMCDVIGRYRPAFVLGENVPGIIGMELDSVLADMESLGYRVQPLVIPACAVDARHRRDRVWIVAHAESYAGKLQQGKWKDLRNEPAINGTQGTIAIVTNTQCLQRQERWESISRQTQERPAPSQSGGYRWLPEAESGVGRVADGVAHRVDRLRTLGNAIVPQVAFEIIRHLPIINP